MSKPMKTLQSGFLLPAAIFLLVILAGLGAYALNINSVQQNTSIQDVQTTRAYHAARAGVEWAVFNVITPVGTLPACPTTTLSLDGFSVAVNCTKPAGDYSEQGGDHTISLYEIESTASFGTPNTPLYFERKIDLTLTKCITSGGELCS